MADCGSVKRRSQINYEQDERAPDARYLAGVAAAGVDIRYVLTGLREPAAGVADAAGDYTSSDPLADQFRRLNPRQRSAIAELVELILDRGDEK